MSVSDIPADVMERLEAEIQRWDRRGEQITADNLRVVRARVRELEAALRKIEEMNYSVLGDLNRVVQDMKNIARAALAGGAEGDTQR
jgi:hypothetical protein